MELFIKRPSSEIPPKSNKAFNSGHEISDWYFANCRTNGDEVQICVVCYDFKHEKWRIKSSGLTEVIEYYIRDERFEYWVQKANKIDIELMYELFSAMNEEDKLIPQS